MLTDDEIDALPDDPQEAFVQVARMARDKADRGIYSDERTSTPYVFGFFSSIRAAANAYEMEEFQNFRAPDPGDSDLLEQYHRFTAQVDEFILQLQLIRKPNLPRYSVALDTAAKTKIHHHLGQIRSEIEGADLDEDKRNALFEKLHDLAKEVDKNRTSFQRTLANLIALAPVGDAAGRIVTRILGVFRDAKEEEERVFKSLAPTKAKLQLPAPSKPKRPNLAPPRETFPKDFDDEIPF